MRVRSGKESAIVSNRRKLQADAVIPSSKWLWLMTNEGMDEASSARTF
jgi:hypothetical protein